MLKVRITADLEERIKNEAERENISHDEARNILAKDDEERRKWALALYGIDPWDSRIYDITIHIGCITVDDAVDLITRAVQIQCFQRTDESQRVLEDYLISARVKVIFPNENVEVKGGVVIVTVEAPLIQEDRIVKDVRQKLDSMEGIKEIRVKVLPSFDTE